MYAYMCERKGVMERGKENRIRQREEKWEIKEERE